MSKKIVAVSGGFDPIHVGHIRMIQEAAALGDHLVVIINNDHWLKKKKDFVFMPEAQRVEVIEAIAGVDKVVLTDHEEDCEDMSVCNTLRDVKPHVFANGGDRNNETTPEKEFCKNNNIETLFGIGVIHKSNSSSWILDKWKK